MVVAVSDEPPTGGFAGSEGAVQFAQPAHDLFHERDSGVVPSSLVQASVATSKQAIADAATA